MLPGRSSPMSWISRRWRCVRCPLSRCRAVHKCLQVTDPLRSGPGLERDGLCVVRIPQGAYVLAPRALRPQARRGKRLPWCWPGSFEERREHGGGHDDVASDCVNLHLPHCGEEINQNDAERAALQDAIGGLLPHPQPPRQADRPRELPIHGR